MRAPYRTTTASLEAMMRLTVLLCAGAGAAHRSTVKRALLLEASDAAGVGAVGLGDGLGRVAQQPRVGVQPHRPVVLLALLACTGR